MILSRRASDLLSSSPFPVYAGMHALGIMTAFSYPEFKTCLFGKEYCHQKYLYVWFLCKTISLIIDFVYVNSTRIGNLQEKQNCELLAFKNRIVFLLIAIFLFGLRLSNLGLQRTLLYITTNFLILPARTRGFRGTSDGLTYHVFIRCYILDVEHRFYR